MGSRVPAGALKTRHGRAEHGRRRSALSIAVLRGDSAKPGF